MKLLRTLAVVLLLAVVCAAQPDAARPSPAEQRQADRSRELQELQQKADQASGSECAKLSMQAARQSLEDADRLFRSGNTQAAQHAIDISLHYAQRAVDCTVQSRKRVKAAEIELRGLIRRMNDVAGTLDSEDRQHLKQVLAELDKERDRLLQVLFGPAAAHSGKKPQ